MLLRAWIPPVILMCLIFAASTDIGSTTHTSRIIGPFLRWLNPDVTESTIELVQMIIRKGGHATEYGILTLLFWRGLRLLSPQTDGWSARTAKWAISLSFLYACSDEFHQSFVPSRGASVWDVLLDTTGATLAIGALWLFGRLRKRW